MKRTLLLLIAALALNGCTTPRTSQTGTIQLPPVEYVK